MIYSEAALARRIFARFLSPWASRAGYFEGSLPGSHLPGSNSGGIPEGMPGTVAESLFPEHIYPIPVHLAPSAYLDGLWVDSQHAPEQSRDLAMLMQTVGAGGVGVLFLSTKHWNRRSVRDFCRGADLQLLFLSPVPSKGRLKLDRRGMPVPRSIIRRILLRLSTAFFPSLTSLFGSELFVIVQKSLGRSRESDGVKLSVIIPVDAKHQNKQRLHEWEEFLSRHRLHEVELICVEDHDTEELPSSSGATIRVQHYRRMGRAACVRSGLLHSRGMSVLIDIDQRCTPAFLFDLLQMRLQAKQQSGVVPDVVTGYEASQQFWWGRRFLNRQMSGLSHPDLLYMMLGDRAVRAVIDIHPEQIRSYPFAVELHLRKQRLKIEEVELIPDPPLATSSKERPSFLTFLYYRLRRGMIYLTLPLWMTLLLWSTVPAGAQLSALSTAARPAVYGLSLQVSAFYHSTNRSLMNLSEERELEVYTIADWPRWLPITGRWMAHGLIAAHDASVRQGEVFVTAVRSLLPEPAIGSLMMREFFFVLALGQSVHLFNVLIVFKRPSGTYLLWGIAQTEALLVYVLLPGMPAESVFERAGETALLTAFLLRFAAVHLCIFPVYSMLFLSLRRK